MYDCPGCQRPLSDRAIVCNACGWEPPAKRKGKADPARGVCENTERGLRCANPGMYSSNTFGNGPWYCLHHFPPFYGWEERKAPPPVEPTSAALTELQWYTVCKFFPAIAARAKRPLVPVGPHEPLDALAKCGPLLAGWQPPDLEAIAEREALQAPGA